MNGQERPQARTSSNFTASDVSVNSAAITGAMKGNSWIREMVANPEQAAQAGIINIHDHSNHRPALHPRFEPSMIRPSTSIGVPPTSFGGDFSYLFKSQYAIPQPTPPSAVDLPQSHLDLSSADPSRLLVPCVTSSNDSPIAALSAIYPNGSKKNAQALVSTADAQLSAKRMKMTKLNENISQISRPASIPHRPEYFHRGAVIQLGEHKLKRIEDLETSDFEYSARISPDLSLDSSTVVNITEDSGRGTAYLTFSVGDQAHKPLAVTVEATLEHPFFVFGHGWSSVKPEITHSYYKMESRQLKIHDRCISLTLKENSSVDSNGFFANHRDTPSAEACVPAKSTDFPQSK